MKPAFGGSKKIRTAIFLLLCLSLFNFISFNSSPPPPPANQDKFLVGAMQTYSTDFTYYNQAGLNFMHYYAGGETGRPGYGTRYTPYSVLTGEHLDNPVLQQANRNVIDNVVSQNGSRILWNTPKIEWLAYGQSSIYEAEDGINKNSSPDWWFYSFNNHDIGIPFEDSQYGVVSQKCRLGIDQPGYVVKRLKANTEQSHRDISSNSRWRGDSECDWFVKPRIRADRNFIVNPNNSEIDICKIYVYLQDGVNTKQINPITIKAKNFQKDYTPENLYNGNYVEEFYFDNPLLFPPRGVQFTGDLVTNDQNYLTWFYAARGECSTDPAECNHADIQVEWLGNCDMYLDYVKVENDVADQLLKGVYDNTWLLDEANAVKNYPSENNLGVYNFYIELCEFSNTPCMAYINQKLLSYTDNKIGLMCEPIAYYPYHLAKTDKGLITSSEQIKSLFYDRTGFNQVFVGDPYTINAAFPHGCSGINYPQFSRISDKLPVHSGSNILADAIAPLEYDAWLQGHLDTVTNLYESNYNEPCCPLKYQGVFRYLMQRGHEISKQSDIPFIAMLQAHQWVWEDAEVDREPTNEELNLITNLAVAYGAKGIIYWWWPSTEQTNLCKYGLGLMEYPNNQPRDTNVYGQAKWDNFLSITNRLNTWGPELISFDNTNRHSCIYRLETERNPFNNATYFRSIASYRPGSGDPACDYDLPDVSSRLTDGLIYECPEYNYVQAATFNTIQGNYTQYFMIVNRRCSPYVDTTTEDNMGGRRYIRVWFDSSSAFFPNPYNSWKIVDLGDERLESIPFNKHTPNKIALGWFMPGEGRLYKIEPVITKGGTLVADEYVSGDLLCEDTVFTNGYNLTIENNSNISFTDTSNFVIQGGSFTMGNSLYSGPPNITCGAVSGNTWNGFVFDNCEVSIYNSAFSMATTDTAFILNMIDCPLIDIQNNSFANSEANLNGSINVTYIDIGLIDNVYIGNNTFSYLNSTIPAVNILSYAGITTPLIIENNTFSSNTDNSTAILLSGITGGAVKQNTITNFKTGLNLLSSSIDFSENTISSNLEGSIGIMAVSGSEIKMNPAGGLQLGGINNISCTANGSSNIKVDNSYFNMDGGENIFDIIAVNNNWHMNGWF